MSLAALKIAALVVLLLAVACAVAAIVGATHWEAGTRDLRARVCGRRPCRTGCKRRDLGLVFTP